MPITIMDVSPEEAEYLLVADNEERRQADDDPMKKSRRAAFLKEYWGVRKGGDRKSKGQNGLLIFRSINDVAEAIGEDERTTKRLLKLNDLIPEIQTLVFSGKLGTTAAEQLAYLSPGTQANSIKCLESLLQKSRDMQAEAGALRGRKRSEAGAKRAYLCAYPIREKPLSGD